MKEVGKAIVTALVWIGTMIISIVNSTNASVFGGDATMATVFPLVIALLATLAIYGIPEMMQAIFRGQRESAPLSAPEKGKRLAGADKMALLMSMMDEDEKQAFKDALKRRYLEHDRDYFTDGELSDDAETLSALMDEDARSARMH